MSPLRWYTKAAFGLEVLMQPAVIPLVQPGDSVPAPGATVIEPPVILTSPWNTTLPVKVTLVPLPTLKVGQFIHTLPVNATVPLGLQLVEVAKEPGAPDVPTTDFSWST